MYNLFLLSKVIPRRKIRVKVQPVLNPPVIITSRPKAVLPLLFHLFYVQFGSIFKCFNFNTSVYPIMYLSKGN